MNTRLALASAGFLALLTLACGPAGGGAGGSSQMQVEVASNGFGRLLPHRIFRADAAGMPTSNVLEITSREVLVANVSTDNDILPVTKWPDSAVLPNGDDGNHFIYVRFNQAIDVGSVLDASSGAAVANNLVGPIEVLMLDPATSESVPVKGRAFIGGRTYGFTQDPDSPGDLVFEQWVIPDPGTSGAAMAAVPEALGFPGTESPNGLAGIADLLSDASFVFIPDADGDLSTHETFPAGVQIRMRMTTSVRAASGAKLAGQALASSTVGDDSVCPEVSIQGQTQLPIIKPGNGDLDVDPGTRITVEFTEPVQLNMLGELDDGTSPGLFGALQVEFGPTVGRVRVPFSIDVPSVFDLTTIELVPAYNFPGAGPLGVSGSCADFATVNVSVNFEQFGDLDGNLNQLVPTTFFTTREGPGLVNAPVTPDALYVGRGGVDQAISVIDLNGFGGGTGDPTYDIANPITQGNSNYPNNPNVRIQGTTLFPPLNPGTCTFDGGSAGAFTLVRDTSLNDIVAGAPILESVGDMALGHALDGAFNNASPFGCQAGGGNLCAQTGLKQTMLSQGGANTLAPTLSSGNVTTKTVTGHENLMNWAPHPNPPPLKFPPQCLSPLINGQEPTSIDSGVALTFLGATIQSGINNLLTPGDFPLGLPEQGIPPTGLLVREQNAFFNGPSQPQTMIQSCNLGYTLRQQIGNFLYVVDRQAGQIVVLNSNRFTVIDRIRLPDPTSLAMSPNLDFLAVTNQGADTVSFIDTDPTSATFHELVESTRVGRGPIGIAWDPGNEDILVCNQASNTVSIISAFDLRVRKTLLNQLTSPFEVAITPRQVAGLAFSRNVYFAYILNENGSVALFESGPDGINGWGFDDVIGQVPFTFNRPKAIQPDLDGIARAAVWIVHEDQLGPNGLPTGLSGGAVTSLSIETASFGMVPLDPGGFGTPTLRDLGFGIRVSIGSDQLTGVPTDIAFDNQRNSAPLTNFASNFSAGQPLSINGKATVRSGGATFTPVSSPRFMFLAIPNSTQGPGVVDVISTDTGFQRFDTNAFEPGVQSIPVPRVRSLMDYFRQ